MIGYEVVYCGGLEVLFKASIDKETTYNLILETRYSITLKGFKSYINQTLEIYRAKKVEHIIAYLFSSLLTVTLSKILNLYKQVLLLA